MKKIVLLTLLAVIVLGGWYLNKNRFGQTTGTVPAKNAPQFSVNNKAEEKSAISKNNSAPDNFPVPLIMSLTPTSGPKGTEIVIKGENLAGFEGSLSFFFERGDGRTIDLIQNATNVPVGADGKRIGVFQIKVVEPCKEGETIYGEFSGLPSLCPYVEFTPGVYKVYTAPWGKKSNSVSFTLTK